MHQTSRQAFANYVLIMYLERDGGEG